MQGKARVHMPDLIYDFHPRSFSCFKKEGGVAISLSSYGGKELAIDIFNKEVGEFCT